MSTPEPWAPTHAASSDAHSALTLSLRFSRHAFPKKPSLPNGLAITRRSRFTVPATGTAVYKVREVARTMLRLMLTADSASEAVVRRVETCLSEITTITYPLTEGDSLVCAVWVDAEHVFLSVEHEHQLPQVAADITIGLHLVKAIAADYGTHFENGVHQTWAAVRR
ncbi:hypothetical protein [Streptomyces rimosus]|uniref:hypothetical protein n=1 Tax=Streptomyces rimosus TaxID=1927 RepID=UPI00131B6008|nr:hypothetical protein [Streptomyces rimosus]